MSRPIVWEIMEKRPPASMRILVTIDNIERLVNKAIDTARRTMNSAPPIPAVPITPRMVSVVEVTTPEKVPKVSVSLSGIILVPAN